LGSVHDGLHVIVKGMTTAMVFVSTSSLELALSLDSGFPGFGCLRVVFLFTKFPLRQQISYLFYFSHLRYFVAYEHTLHNLEVNIYFSNAKITWESFKVEYDQSFFPRA